MTTDSPGLREAINRLRRIKAGEDPFLVYGHMMTDDTRAMHPFHQREFIWERQQDDHETIADDWLATLPPDADEPISEEWLREIGWTRVQLRLEMVVDGRTIELYDCVIADSPMRGLLVIFFKKNTKSIYNWLANADNCIYHSSIATEWQSRRKPKRG